MIIRLIAGKLPKKVFLTPLSVQGELFSFCQLVLDKGPVLFHVLPGDSD